MKLIRVVLINDDFQARDVYGDMRSGESVQLGGDYALAGDIAAPDCGNVKQGRQTTALREIRRDLDGGNDMSQRSGRKDI